MAATEALDNKGMSMKALLGLVLLVGSTVVASPAHAAPPLCFGKAPTIIGTRGDDLALAGTSGNDVIWAKRGNDIVFGMGGDDRICGGRGADELHGGYATAPESPRTIKIPTARTSSPATRAGTSCSTTASTKASCGGTLPTTGCWEAKATTFCAPPEAQTC